MFGGTAMIPWALANWGKVIAGILVLSITIYIGVLKFQLGSARGEAAELRGKVSELNSEIAGWKQTYAVMADVIKKQSDAAKKLEDQKKQAEDKRLQADKKAAVIVAHQKEAETRLEAIPSVPEASSTCEAEMDVIKQMLQVGSKGYTGVGQ
jgi:chromosome segregation ATPase